MGIVSLLLKPQIASWSDCICQERETPEAAYASEAQTQPTVPAQREMDLLVETPS